MTTVLADANRGVMVADSKFSDGDRVWYGEKVLVVDDAVIGLAGDHAHLEVFADWWARGCRGRVSVGESTFLILCDRGLLTFDANYRRPTLVRPGVEAIGTGGKAALCAYEALDWQDPRRAVAIAAKHDAASGGRIRTYRFPAVSQ